MDRNSKRYAGQGCLGKGLKVLAVVAMASGLSGCLVSIPPAVQFASYALDAVLYIETDKTMTDHALSAVTDQDCSMGRVLSGNAVCHEDGPVTYMAIDRDIHTVDFQAAIKEDGPKASLEVPYTVAGAKRTEHLSLEQILNSAATPSSNMAPTLAQLPQLNR